MLTENDIVSPSKNGVPTSIIVNDKSEFEYGVASWAGA